MTENQWRDSVLRPRLDTLKMYYFIKEANSVRGLPDIIGVFNGKFFCLEIKKAESELRCKRTPLQRYVLQLIRNFGGFAEFIYPENFETVVKDLITFCSSDTSK